MVAPALSRSTNGFSSSRLLFSTLTASIALFTAASFFLMSYLPQSDQMLPDNAESHLSANLRDFGKAQIQIKNVPGEEKLLRPAPDAAQQDKTESQGHSLENYVLPVGLRRVLERATQNQDYCSTLEAKEEPITNTTDLPSLGIVNALSSYKPSSEEEAKQWQCEVPPSNECQVNSFTVIFLGHNPERLDGMKRQIYGFIDGRGVLANMVEEVIIVWNGPRELNETKAGEQLVQMDQDSERPVRMVYPLKMGYPNDLLNRYDPRTLHVKTKCILYYDDDGPFYSHDAILAAFELWKRNSDTQVGAMARRLDLSARQQAEKQKILNGQISERQFVPHCRAAGDSVWYNYHHFAQFGANMVLPSGTFVHSNYLCFIWHPALEEVRRFVRAHPVHPDDATVSTIVSQISGRAPRVHSRRLPNKPYPDPKPEKRRKLLWEQEGWGDMRNGAVNSLTSYFGSMNSGSVAWCDGTEYQHFSKKDGYHFCEPEMARIGLLPWMSPRNTPLEVCP